MGQKSSSPLPSKFNFFVKKLLFVLSFLFIVSGSFFLGFILQPKHRTIDINSTSTTDGYTLYRYLAPHIGTPIFQMEIPSNWSAYTTTDYDNPTVVYFGQSHPSYYKDFTVNIPGEVQIIFGKNYGLTLHDPSTWSSSDKEDYFIGAPPEQHVNVTVDGVQARKYEIPGIGPNSTEIFLTKGDMIFGILNYSNNVDSTTFNHMLKTFEFLHETYSLDN